MHKHLINTSIGLARAERERQVKVDREFHELRKIDSIELPMGEKVATTQLSRHIHQIEKTFFFFFLPVFFFIELLSLRGTWPISLFSTLLTIERTNRQTYSLLRLVSSNRSYHLSLQIRRIKDASKSLMLSLSLCFSLLCACERTNIEPSVALRCLAGRESTSRKEHKKNNS